MTKKNTQIEKVSGKVENIVPIELDVYAGFTSPECVEHIKNRTMKKLVKDYAKAVQTEINSKWNQATCIAHMTEDMRKEFGNDAAVANFLGLTRGQFSKLQRAGMFAIEYLDKGNTELPSFNVFTELLPVTGDKYGNQNIYLLCDYVLENEMTQAEVRDYVKGFKQESDSTKKTKNKKTATQSDTDSIISEKTEKKIRDNVNAKYDIQKDDSSTKQEDAPHFTDFISITSEARERILNQMDDDVKHEMTFAIATLLKQYFDDDDFMILLH